MVEHCRLCGSARTEESLSRPYVPVHQNLLVPNEQHAIAMPSGDLRMTVCRACGIVFNAAFDPSHLAYDEHHDSTQMCSEVFALEVIRVPLLV